MVSLFLEKVDELKEILIQMKRAYPNGYHQLLWEAQRLFEELTDLPFDEGED